MAAPDRTRLTGRLPQLLFQPVPAAVLDGAAFRPPRDEGRTFPHGSGSFRPIRSQGGMALLRGTRRPQARCPDSIEPGGVRKPIPPHDESPAFPDREG